MKPSPKEWVLDQEESIYQLNDKCAYSWVWLRCSSCEWICGYIPSELLYEALILCEMPSCYLCQNTLRLPNGRNPQDVDSYTDFAWDLPCWNDYNEHEGHQHFRFPFLYTPKPLVNIDARDRDKITEWVPE